MGVKYSWWKPEEIELIKKQLQQGVAIENVMIPGRKAEYIWRQARKNGLVERQRHRAMTDEQKAELRELKEQGFSARKIADVDIMGLPHRTANAIQKIFGKIGMVNENRSLAAKNKKRWLDGEKQMFDIFLHRHSMELAPQQIAERFGVKKATVLSRQVFLGVKTSLAETLAIPYVRRKIERSSQERSRRILLDFERHTAEREKQLEALAQKLRRQKRIVRLDDRQCKKCGLVWLKHKKFFFHATYKTNSGTSWHFSRTCVICAAKYRHKKKVAKYEKKYSKKLE